MFGGRWQTNGQESSASAAAGRQRVNSNDELRIQNDEFVLK